jgi:predicted O-linked N-acetylglucosamine transferase (SPINDLY family)
LRRHSCAYFLEPLLRHLDPAAFEVFLYHDHFREDAVSTRLRSLATVWRNLFGEPDRSVEQIVRADAPDILIDLAGHTGISNRLPLFAGRLAPVQVTYLGYPNTTGVPAMDYRFTDAVADPPGEADGFATETLIRFAPTAWCYAAPADAPVVVPPPCRERGYVTFGSFNDPGKITDRMLALWSRILRELPAARLRLKGRGLDESAVRTAFCLRLARAGLPGERVDLCERLAETRAHLEQYGEVDIALDPFPYHGTTTTCEALWMGVPVVTRVGDRHVSRVGASLVAAVGHGEWLAAGEDEYVRIATDLAKNGDQLLDLRRQLRGQVAASRLCDSVGQSARFAAALRACWTAACDREGHRRANSG